MLPYIDVLNHLEHTHYRSGQDLANLFGVTRATIHNCILRIIAMGISVERVRGKGYKLSKPLDLLDQSTIKSKLAMPVSNHLHQLEILQEVDSTNNYIAGCELPDVGRFSVVMAEMQTSGKGRRGRLWVSPYAENIYMSLLWPLQTSLSEVGALSPLLSIAMLHALDSFGVKELGVKWPNDIYCQNKKLAGVLIECSGEISGNSKMIIGIGVNVYMSQHDKVDIDQEWTDVISHTASQHITRSALAASLLNHVVAALEKFEHFRTSNLLDEWEQWDVLNDKPVVLHAANENISGIARGIDERGHLLLEVDGGIQQISAGDVSLRAHD